MESTFLDDFTSDNRRYFYPFCGKVAIFAPSINDNGKMKMKRLLTLATLFIIYGSSIQAKDYTITSPNGKNVVKVIDDMKIVVSHQDREVVTIKADLATSRFTPGKVGLCSGESPSFPGGKF